MVTDALYPLPAAAILGLMPGLSAVLAVPTFSLTSSTRTTPSTSIVTSRKTDTTDATIPGDAMGGGVTRDAGATSKAHPQDPGVGIC